MILNDQFIKDLMEHRNRTTYARITVLTLDERPIETIEGRITGGSISNDGNSAVRRTCNLSLVGKDITITQKHWAIKSKFKLEVGVENHVDSSYDDIIWFKQGIFGITSFSLSENASSITVSI
jgi:hypothetical protein